MNKVVVTGTNGHNKIRIIGAAKANSSCVVKLNPAFVFTSHPLRVHKGAPPAIAIHNRMPLGSTKSLAKKSLGFSLLREKSGGNSVILAMVLVMVLPLALLVMF